MLPQVLRVETKEIPCQKKSQGHWYRGRWNPSIKKRNIPVRILEIAGIGPMMFAGDVGKALDYPPWKYKLAGAVRELDRCGCGNSMPELPPNLRGKVLFLDGSEFQEFQKKNGLLPKYGRRAVYGILLGIEFFDFWLSRKETKGTAPGIRYLHKMLHDYTPLSELAGILEKRNAELEKRNAELEAVVAQLATTENRNTQLEQMFTGLLTACKTLNLEPLPS